jgi:outer membrane protein TolC
MRLFDELTRIKHPSRLMQPNRSFVLVLACCLALSAAARDTQPTQPAQTPPSALPEPSSTRAPRMLSLAECIQLALEHNLDIQIQRYNPIIDQYTLDLSYAGYEPTFNFSAQKSYNSSPGSFIPNSIVQNPSFVTESANFNPEILGTLPTGLTYDMTGPLSKRTQNSTNTTWSASPGITLSQPLLRNFWIDNTRLQIQLNKANLKISEQALRLQIMTTVTSVKTAYYNLIFDRENVDVQATALKLAQQLAAENKKKVEVGTLAPLDEKQAESQAASSQAALLLAQHTLVTQENTLKVLLSDNYYRDWANVSPVPTEQLSAEPQPLNLQESWRRAVTQRPDYLEQKLNVEKQNVTLKYDFNQLFPELNVTGSYGRNAFNSSFDDTLNNIRTDQNSFYSYGAVVSIPLGNSGPRANYKSGKATLKQVLLQLKQLEQNILLEVDNDVGQVESTLQQVDATREARIYAEDALAAEQKKLENGKSTSFQVLQLISNLTTARSAEIQALANYNIALAQLSLDEGSTLEKDRIDLKVK